MIFLCHISGDILLLKQVSNSLCKRTIPRDHFLYKLAIYALVNKKMTPQSPMDSFPCDHVHNCIFSIDSIKYVYKTGPFHESSYGPQQVHECIKIPQHQNNTFQVTILWCINDEFSSLPIQGLVESYNGGKIVLHGKVGNKVQCRHNARFVTRIHINYMQ